MSRIAAMLVLSAAPANGPPLNAEQVLRAHGRATSIGPDPCRTPGAGEEIVVCARRESPYALPLYDPDAGTAASQAGGGRDAAMGAARDSAAPCHARGEPCIRPLPLMKRKF